MPDFAFAALSNNPSIPPQMYVAVYEDVLNMAGVVDEKMFTFLLSGCRPRVPCDEDDQPF